jgi:hypothetical protein
MNGDLRIRKDLSERRTLAVGIASTVAYGLAGWVFCAATMGAAMAVTDLGHALFIHALAAPAIFVAVSFLYFRRFGASYPLRTAIVFVAVVIAMDLFLVALLIEKSFAMFESFIGTWLPFASIFLATWLTGIVLQRANSK